MDNPEIRFFAGASEEVEKGKGEDEYTALSFDGRIISRTIGDICGGYVEFRFLNENPQLITSIGDEEGRKLFDIDPVPMRKKDILQITWELNYG